MGAGGGGAVIAGRGGWRGGMLRRIIDNKENQRSPSNNIITRTSISTNINTCICLSARTRIRTI